MTDIWTPAGFTDITSADLIHESVDNVPHNELDAIVTEINTHHDGSLTHTGDFTISQNLYVSGSSITFNSTNLAIEDLNVVLNVGGASKNGSGFTMTSSSGDLATFAISGSTWHCGSAPLSATREIAVSNSDGTLTLPATGTGSAAISLTLAQALAAGGASSTTPMTGYSLSLTIPVCADRIIEVEDFSDLWQVKNTWESTGALPAGRTFIVGAGVQNAAICFGGQSAAGYTNRQTTVYRYDGSTWGALGSGLSSSVTEHAGCGLMNSALSFMGVSANTAGDTTKTEKYLGNTWAAVAAPAGTARYSLAGCGKQLAALAVGGYSVSTSGARTVTERFNGDSWVTAGSLGTAVFYSACVGHQNSALNGGGSAGTTTVEIYNGITDVWYSAPALNSGLTRPNGEGVRNNALFFGDSGAITQRFNGISWITISATSAPTITYKGGSAGSANAVIHAGGGASFGTASWRFHGEILLKSTIWNDSDQLQNETKSYYFAWDDNEPQNQTTEIDIIYRPELILGATDAEKADLVEIQRDLDYGTYVWTASSALSPARAYHAGAGGVNSAIIYGGSSGTEMNSSATWNGSSWSAGANMLVTRRDHAGTGSAKAALAMRGKSGADFFIWTTEYYNGNAWASSSNMPTSASDTTSCGKFNAALSGGGRNGGGYLATWYLWNGSSWSATASSAVQRPGSTVGGNIYSALVVGDNGYVSTMTTEIFNGTTWSYAQNVLFPGFSYLGKGATRGTPNNALQMGGFTGSYQTWCQRFNGLNWTLTAPLLTACSYFSGTGSSDWAGCQGGFNGAIQSVTSIYSYNHTPPSTIANIIVKG